MKLDKAVRLLQRANLDIMQALGKGVPGALKEKMSGKTPLDVSEKAHPAFQRFKANELGRGAGPNIGSKKWRRFGVKEAVIGGSWKDAAKGAGYFSEGIDPLAEKQRKKERES